MTTDETSTALALRPAALSGYIPPPAKDEFEAMISMANTLAKAQGFLPAHFYGQPYKILAAILYGRDLGISATNALQHIIVIEGKATADAQLIGMLVRRAGHRLEDKTTDQASTVTITRDDGTIHTVTFTMADAQRAGLVRAGGAWTKYPSAMLYARALTACARKGAQDALMGTIYTPEELGVEPEDGQPSAAPVVEVAEFREIPIDQASAASQEAVQKQGDATVPSPDGPAPMAAASSSGTAAPAAEQTQPAGPSLGGASVQRRMGRSIGPAARRTNVVTVEQAPTEAATAEKDARAGTPAEPITAIPGAPGLTDDPIAAEPDGLAPQRELLRQAAAELAHLNAIARNHLQHALKGEALEEVPPTVPSKGSDESLQNLIQKDYAGKTLDTLTAEEIQNRLELIEPVIAKRKAQLAEKRIAEQ